MPVPPQLPSKTPCALAFIGEAPSDEEVVEGKPLVGPSGRVFNALLRAAGIDRSACLVTNVFDQKAPANDVSPWLRDPAVFNPALTRLAAELEAAKPTVIVPMGGTALWAFTGRDSIMDYRGAVAKATVVGAGVKLVPTLHPAFVMRQWKYWPVVLGDLVRVLREVERGPGIVLPVRSLLIEPTIGEVESYCANMGTEPGPLSVDIETGWGQITSFGIAPTQEVAMCIPFVDLRQPDKSYWRTAEEEVRAWRAIRTVMESPVPKLGQNFGGYDAYWILSHMGIRSINFREDTRLLHHALYPELPKDLGFMGSAYTEQGAWKMMGYRGRDKRDD